MTVVYRSKKPPARPAAEDHPLYDLLNDLGATFASGEPAAGRALEALEDGGDDPTSVTEELVGMCAHVTEIGAHMDAWLEGDSPDATDLYTRSVENRRVMFLELVAWAIIQAEEAAARGDDKKFAADLMWNRGKHWKPMPWPGAAKDADRFQGYVAGLARGFTNDGGGSYPLRRASEA